MDCLGEPDFNPRPLQIHAAGKDIVCDMMPIANRNDFRPSCQISGCGTTETGSGRLVLFSLRVICRLRQTEEAFAKSEARKDLN
jgi:hypothetical protein